MVKIFQKKLLKIAPMWLVLIIIFAGTVIAAVTWISNPLNATVTVTSFETTITGSFASSTKTHTSNLNSFTYALNAPTTNVTGYIFLSFDGLFTSENDLEVTTSMVQREDGYWGGVVLSKVYEGDGETGVINLKLGRSGNEPLVFDKSGGTISFYTTYYVPSEVNAQIRLSSTLE